MSNTIRELIELNKTVIAELEQKNLICEKLDKLFAQDYDGRVSCPCKEKIDFDKPNLEQMAKIFKVLPFDQWAIEKDFDFYQTEDIGKVNYVTHFDGMQLRIYAVDVYTVKTEVTQTVAQLTKRIFRF